MPLSVAQTDLVNRLLSRLDADTPGNNVVGGESALYDQILFATRQMILDRRVPDRMLHAIVSTDTAGANTNHSDTTYGLVVPLKSDFLRLFRLKVSGWRRPVHHDDLLEEDDPDVERLVAGGHTADAASPLACLSYLASPPDGYSSSAILCFPGSTSDDPVEELVYIADDVAPENLSADLQELVLWLSASIVMQSLDPEVAAMCESRYSDSLQRLGRSRKTRAKRSYRYLP